MKITPLDIQQQQFKGKMIGGLDPEDVDSFLQTVASEMEGLIRENNDLKEQMVRMNRELEDLAEKERDLRETILAAQKISEEMKTNARKESELILSEAELKAEKIVANAERSLADLNNRIQEIRCQKIQFESSLKSLLEIHAKILTGDESA